MLICNIHVTIACVYGPNTDNSAFFENFFQQITHINNEYTVLCGDWNLVLNQYLDYENYSNVYNPQARDTALNFIEVEVFIDIWRQNNEIERRYTWKRFNPKRIQSRLDFYLISQNVVNFIIDTNIVPGYRSDHSGITLQFSFFNTYRGRGYWKFHNSLLKDEKYIGLVKKLLNTLIKQHTTEHDTNNLYENLALNINDQLFLETFFVVLRGETIKFC
jgi:hypothetical protein